MSAHRTYLIDLNDMFNLCDFISTNISYGDIKPYIRKAQDFDLKVRLGNSLYTALEKWFNFPDSFDDPYLFTTFFEGGVFTDRCQKTEKTLTGLKTALCYYTYSWMCKTHNLDVSRFGVTTKEEAYSSRPDPFTKRALELEARHTADMYLFECLEYLRYTENYKDFEPYSGCRCGNRQNNNINFKVIRN